MQTKIFNDFIFEGILAPLIEKYIIERRNLGYTANTEGKQLRNFSQFSKKFNIPKDTLPKNVVMEWLAKKEEKETDSNVQLKYAIIRGFADYMKRNNYKAFKPEKFDMPKMHTGNYIPYIFSYSQIFDFFKALDSIKDSKYSNSHRRTPILQSVFRLLYCCGMRISEVSHLKTEDINLEKGIITIWNSKYDKSRYIPINNELIFFLQDYKNKYPTFEYFFPSLDGGYYSTHSFYEPFRNILFDAHIPHLGRGYGPRIHDFRHTFAVHCLHKWVRTGVPLQNALPRLSTYLGHSNMKSTEKYLRLTAEVYPEIIEILSQQYGYLIPKE